MSIKKKINWVMAILLFVPIMAIGQAQSVKIDRSNTTPDLNTSSGYQMLSRGVDEAEWIHYDDAEMEDSWGFLISGEEYDVVAKWDPEDITDYDNWQITKIKFIVVTDNPIYKIKVWEGEDFTEIYSQDVTDINENWWTEVTLDTPVTIDASQELWVGYYVDYTDWPGGLVTATDAGPPVDEYGNLYRFNGTWYSDFNNHNLQVYIESALSADFEADETDVCEGSTVNFSDLSISPESWSWTFEGGTPSTSTEQNPSVVYDTPGTYDVSLEVSLGTETDTEVKVGYINVYEIPGQAAEPDGETDICSGQIYFYETEETPYAQEYEWVLNPEEAGYFSWQDNYATLETDEDWTGDFTIKVRATNICGEGEWSEELACSTAPSPSVFNLEGGGTYCLGDDGVEITLDDSEEGIDYELLLGGDPTGIIVSGTGSEISFGLVTEEGTYEALAYNDNCEITMSNQISVAIDFYPLEPSTPEGPVQICNESTSIYTTTEQDDADSYMWSLSPEEAGSISGSGIESTVVWEEGYAGLAYVYVNGVNDCGEGNSSPELEVTVGIPAPEITGEALVCDLQIEDYMVEDHEGSTYSWEVSGGTITAGQDSYIITVEWGGAGTGYVSVTEETADGCQADAEDFEVTIDECTGIGENGSKREISVYPNPATGEFIHIDNLDLKLGYSIQIINSSGNIIMQLESNGQKQTVNISELSQGLYFLKVIYSDDLTEIGKFIKR